MRDRANTMKYYTVQQTFETLGDPSESHYETRADALAAAVELRESIATMVGSWPTPDYAPDSRTGFTNENDAWISAEGIAGVKFDEGGERTADSPKVWGRTVGEMIADTAVEITETEE